MKKIIIITALVALVACSDNSDVFYSTSYPIVEINADVTVGIAEGYDAAALTEEIKNHIIDNAPVRAGGGYALDFISHNGGRLSVKPDAAGNTIAGAFIKEPNSRDTLRFAFGENRVYNCALSSYRGNGGVSQTLFSVDLTEQYQQAHPEAEIIKAIRKEYTSHPY